jgi:hypothetical protein
MKYLSHPESDSTFACECKGDVPDCCLNDGCVCEIDYKTFAKLRQESGETSLDQPLSDVLLIAHRKTANPNRRDHSVNVTLTISVDHPSELPAAVLALAASLSDGAPAAMLPQGASVSVEPAKRGRKPKADTAEAPTAEVSTPAASPAEVVAARIAAVSAETPPTPPQTAPAVSTPAVAPTAAVDKKTLTDALVAVVKHHGASGRDIVGAICRAHGAPNLSALAESTYVACFADAQTALKLDTEAAKQQFLAAA